MTDAPGRTAADGAEGAAETGLSPGAAFSAGFMPGAFWAPLVTEAAAEAPGAEELAAAPASTRGWAAAVPAASDNSNAARVFGRELIFLL